jgi:predicted amidohydrolase/ribosomal protein S18 acetylase RimI-like enzyme
MKQANNQNNIYSSLRVFAEICKKVFFMATKNDNVEHILSLRNLQLTDYEDMVEIINYLYGKINMDGWSYNQIKKLCKVFPEGQICIEDKGKVVAFALSLIIDEDDFDDNHTYEEITGNETFSTHNREGNILYGIEVCVHKDYQGMRIGRRLYDARKELCEQLNLKSIVAGARMPGFAQHKQHLKPRDYLEKVKSKEIHDPVLSFQLSNDFHVRKILSDYLPEDTQSKSYAALIEWNNVYYQRKKKLVGGKKTWVRIGLIQWQMRSMPTVEAFLENVEFFVDSVSGYKADFLIFPELFNAPLMVKSNNLDSARAIRQLAQYTEEIKQQFINYAVEYNINIIAGSMPLYKEGNLYNVSYLCRRDGTHDVQYKIHPTPSEVREWGMQGGSKLRVFDTDICKIGILICYDAEFPELGRILADQGMQILFVPAATDLQSAYQRVRYCSQARAIENECYVVMSGSVGNLPKVFNMDIQYAQSAIFSPSDFAFPQNAIIAEGTANTEMTIIADVDLDLLKEVHTQGSVQNLRDRRKDLYEVKWIKE